MTTTVVRATSPSALLSLIPHLLECTPQQSLVVVPFGRGRSLGAMRVNLPPAGATTHEEGVASTVVGMACKVSQTDAVLIAVYTDEPTRRRRWPPTLPSSTPCGPAPTSAVSASSTRSSSAPRGGRAISPRKRVGIRSPRSGMPRPPDCSRTSPATTSPPPNSRPRRTTTSGGSNAFSAMSSRPCDASATDVDSPRAPRRGRGRRRRDRRPASTLRERRRAAPGHVDVRYLAALAFCLARSSPHSRVATERSGVA